LYWKQDTRFSFFQLWLPVFVTCIHTLYVFLQLLNCFHQCSFYFSLWTIHESEFSIFRNHLNSFFSKYENPRPVGTFENQSLQMADTVTDLDVYICIYLKFRWWNLYYTYWLPWWIIFNCLVNNTFVVVVGYYTKN